LKLFDFLEFKIIDIIDILLVAIVLYYIYKLVKGTVAINIFIGIVIVYLIWKLTETLQMKMISGIFGGFMSVGLIALIIVFQQEIRKFLLMIGSANITRRKNFIKRLKFIKQDEFIADTDVEAVLAACQKMSTTKTGALLVIERSNPLDFVKNNGDKMNVEINQPILESIFFKNSPLHDGAAIIDGNYIVATRVALPVSDNRNIPLRFGLRHKAAVGITERTDALALVVSEETGAISYIKNGEFVMYKNIEELSKIIQKDLV
jgi:uncharacterized protein (TIGR00159 family)